MSKSTWDVENGLTVYDPQDETDPTLGSQMWNIGMLILNHMQIFCQRQRVAVA